MSRVQWAKMLQRERFEFVHNISGRLIDPPSRAVAPASWAVAGGSEFLRWAVPALQKHGRNVVALSVVSSSQHDVSARLRAQDEQDNLLNALRVPLGLAPEVLRASDTFSALLCDPAHMPNKLANAVCDVGKDIYWAHAAESSRWLMPPLPA